MRRTAAALCAFALIGPAAAHAGSMDEAAQALAELSAMRWQAEVSQPRIAAIVDAAVQSLNAADEQWERQLAGAERLPPVQRFELRARRCAIAFMRGELYRSAFEALPRTDPSRTHYAAQAIDTFRQMRVEYRDISCGALGYVGEARTRRAMGEHPQSQAALAPLLAESKNGPGRDARIWRLAELERLETLLVADPRRAWTEIQAAERRGEFRPGAAGHGQLEWIKARAAGTLGQSPAAAAMLRASPVVEAAPMFQRLELLSQLGAMEPQEQVTWADLLARYGHQEQARTSYRQLAEQTPQLFTAQRWVSYGRLLLEAGQAAPAADAFENALAAVDEQHEGRTDAIRYRAAALAAAMRQSPGNSELTARTRAALLEVVTSDAPQASRAAALKQWVALHGNSDPMELLSTLSVHEELAQRDPFIRHVRIRAQWMTTREQGDQESARRLALEADNVRAAAAETGDHVLAASATLLGSTILSSEPLRDAPSALRSLGSHWAIIAESPRLLPEAVALRADLLWEIGLIDDAEALLVRHGQDLKLPPSLLLKVAASLAERYKPSSPDSELRRRVTSLCHRALATAAHRDEYASAAQSAAAALLRVEAFADAKKLLPPSEGLADAGAASLRARAMLGAGDVDGAVALLEQIAEESPDSPGPLMELGAIRDSLGQHERALAAYRHARQLARPGTVPWWEATLAVVHALEQCSRSGEARDVLRVALALHPMPQRPTLQSRIHATQLLLKESRDTGVSQ